MKIKKITKFLKIILPKNVIGITLCPFGIYIDDLTNIYTINHENIHWQQQLEMGVLLFYIFYFFEWLIKYFLTKDAYMNLSFEREAYNNEYNFNYISSRKHYSWVKYLFYNKK